MSVKINGHDDQSCLIEKMLNSIPDNTHLYNTRQNLHKVSHYDLMLQQMAAINMQKSWPGLHESRKKKTKYMKELMSQHSPLREKSRRKAVKRMSDVHIDMLQSSPNRSLQ